LTKALQHLKVILLFTPKDLRTTQRGMDMIL